MFLICHVMSQDHMIKRSCDFMGRSPQGKSPPCQVSGHRHYGNGGMFFICHVISQDHGIKDSRDFMRVFMRLYACHTFAFLFHQTFLLINSISLFFEPWIFCHLPLCFPVSSCFLCLFKCCTYCSRLVPISFVKEI